MTYLINMSATCGAGKLKNEVICKYSQVIGQGSGTKTLQYSVNKRHVSFISMARQYQ